MRKLALATAAAIALAFSAPAFTAPALAQSTTVVKVRGDGDRVVRKKTVIRHGGDVTRRKVVIRHGGDVERRKVVIRHGDRGRHHGWRHRDAGNRTVIINKRGGEGSSRTVIKRKTVID